MKRKASEPRPGPAPKPPSEPRPVSELARLIRSRREELGWSGARLAGELGLSPAFVSLVESGNRLPRLSRARELAEKLELDPDLLTRLVLDERYRLVSSSSPPSASWPDSQRVSSSAPWSRLTSEQPPSPMAGAAEVPLLELRRLLDWKGPDSVRETVAVPTGLLRGPAGLHVVVRITAADAPSVDPSLVPGDLVVILLGHEVRSGALHLASTGRGARLGRVGRLGDAYALLPGTPQDEVVMLESGERAIANAVVGRAVALMRQLSP